MLDSGAKKARAECFWWWRTKDFEGNEYRSIGAQTCAELQVQRLR